MITESRCVNSVSFCQQMTLNFGEKINDFIRLIIILALAGEVVERQHILMRCLFLHGGRGGGGFNSDIKLFRLLWFDLSVRLLPSLPAAAAQEAADAPPAEGNGGRDGNQYGDDDIQTVILEPVQVM